LPFDGIKFEVYIYAYLSAEPFIRKIAAETNCKPYAGQM
jgi:hypothetical protein